MINQIIKFFGIAVLISALTFLAAFLSAGCLVSGQKVNQNSDERVQVTADLPAEGDFIEIDLYESSENHLENLVGEISRILELTPLPKTAQPEELEFRVWTNLGGLGNPKLLGVRSVGTDNNAYFFDINRHPFSIKLRRDRLAVPKSGWEKMLFELKSRLITPKGLVRDPQFRLNRDEPLILLEVLDKGEYRRVFYGQRTTFQDGRRLIHVCEYLASEFAVSLNCG